MSISIHPVIKKKIKEAAKREKIKVSEWIVKYLACFIPLSAMIMIGCGGAAGLDPEARVGGGVTPTFESPSPTPDPTLPEAEPFTDSFANNFCNKESSELNCFGDVVFHLNENINGVLIGRDSVCITRTGYQVSNTDLGSRSGGGHDDRLSDSPIECYSASLGPIEMDLNLLLGSAGTTLSILSVKRESDGKTCFNIRRQSGSVSKVCGYTITNTGDMSDKTVELLF